MASGTTDVEAFANEKLADGRSVEQARSALAEIEGLLTTLP